MRFRDTEKNNLQKTVFASSWARGMLCSQHDRITINQ